jgi:ATP-dependent protease ClpP protease subunit
MSPRSDYRERVRDMVAALRAKAAERAPEAAICAAEGLAVHNVAGETAVLRIYDEVSYWGISAIDVIAELDRVTAPQIRVEINSPGGDVFDGIAIYNALRSHPATVTTQVDGLAASIASVIVQAGDTRTVQPAGQLMIHNAWGLVVGDRNDHSDMARLLEQQDEIIAGIYAARSGRDVDEFRALMDAETWLTGDAAVELGLADSAGALAPAARARPHVAVPPSPVPPAAPADASAVLVQIAANANRRRR